jgi:hypothetical protein
MSTASKVAPKLDELITRSANAWSVRAWEHPTDTPACQPFRLLVSLNPRSTSLRAHHRMKSWSPFALRRIVASHGSERQPRRCLSICQLFPYQHSSPACRIISAAHHCGHQPRRPTPTASRFAKARQPVSCEGTGSSYPPGRNLADTGWTSESLPCEERLLPDIEPIGYSGRAPEPLHLWRLCLCGVGLKACLLRSILQFSQAGDRPAAKGPFWA